MKEILAPCGGYESLAAALNTGADAVYAGLRRFSARKNAENFSDEEFSKAVLECHKRGVKIYAAINTLVYDGELALLAECLETAVKCGADGVILQDLGAMELAKELCPEMSRHASTQMSLNSVCGVKAAEELGFSRVVIGRELSAGEISEISQNTSAELEIFVHGALCVSVSGQCYMSSIFGGRSGNRGLCAQPCRLDFTANGRHNVISLKDSSLIPKINCGELAGVCSFKIEGRMKRPEYVACAVDACKKAVLGEKYDKERLAGIFSRGGLTEGYFDGTMHGMCGIRGKEDVENSARALNGIKELYKSEFPRIAISIFAEIAENKPLRATARCVFGEVEVISDKFPEKATGAPLDEKTVCERMSKLGSTQFYAENVTADVGEGLYVSAAELNSLRRELCARLENLVLEKCSPKYEIRTVTLPEKRVRESNFQTEVKFRAEVYSKKQLDEALTLDFELIYAPIGLLSEKTPDKERVAVALPLNLADCEKETEKRLLTLREYGFCKGLAQTLGHAYLLKKCGFEVCGGYRMNILNSLAAKACGELGFRDITLSFEGTAAVLSEINSPIPRGILAYGRLPLMLTRRCPLCDGAPCGKMPLFSEGKGCGGCIYDRKGNALPVLCGGNSVELLNPEILVLSDKQQVLRQFDFAVLKFTTESEIAPVLDMYKNKVKPNGRFTRGLYFRGAE